MMDEVNRKDMHDVNVTRVLCMHRSLIRVGLRVDPLQEELGFRNMIRVLHELTPKCIEMLV